MRNAGENGVRLGIGATKLRIDKMRRNDNCRCASRIAKNCARY